MRSRLLIVLTAVSLVTTGCIFKSAHGQAPTPQMISDSLLTVTDMSPGWNESQRQVFTTRAPENPSIDPSVWCAAAATVSKNLVSLAGDAGADVEMNYNDAVGSNRMMRLQGWTNSNVKAYFNDAKESARICDGQTWTDSNGATTTDKVITGRSIGDQSISWSEKVTPPPGTQKDKYESIGRTTIARFGAIIMVLQLGDAAPVGTGTLMNEDDWWAIVTKAGTKLARLDRQVHS